MAIRCEIDVFAVENDPFPTQRRHRRANALQRHHVFEGERMLGGVRSLRLHEYGAGENKTDGGENLHAFRFYFVIPSEVKEWSEWDERHGWLCREGSGERVGKRTSSISNYF
jgi:hypothetical protein